MIMLTAAFDCSHDAKEKYFIMAGFVSSAERWSDFDGEWRKRLAIDGLPYFHMQPFAQSFQHPKKPFDQSWVGNEGRRQALLGDLLDIIQLHAWHKVACIIPDESFRMFSREECRNYFPTKIAAAARLVWPDIEDWRRREKFREPARLVFEDGDADKGTLIEAVKEMTGRTPAFESKKDIPEKEIVGFTPLQAADILAYEAQKQTQDLGKFIDQVRFRFPYNQLERIPGDVRVLKEAGTEIMVTGMKVTRYFSEHPLGGGKPQ